MTRRRLSDTARVCAPLSKHEKGRGTYLSPERLAEIESECLRLIRAGVNQQDIARALGGASKSRVSRWCQSAVKKSGDQTVHHLINSPTSTPLQRLWSRIDVRGADDCWNWLGSKRPNGYGSPPYRDAAATAHREVYRLLICEISDNMVVDHKCRNPSCCNPRHLQVATQNENIYFAKVRDAARIPEKG